MRAVLLVALFVCVGITGGCDSPRGDSVEILNVSYDPTRELWKDVNEAFIPHFHKQTGKTIAIQQSHGGSGSQARAIIDGLQADVATLGLHSDTDALRTKGLVAEGWEKRLPNNSLPYFSTIVFVVRQGNPKGVKDWPDLIADGVKVISPNPKISGNGKLSFLAAWGSVVQRKGSEGDARDFVQKLYQHIPVLDSGARGATTTFAKNKLGDVHLTWENEAYLELKEFPGELEIVYPPVSIRAEPFVTVVDANVDRKGTRAAAEAYLKFLYTDVGQEIIAKHHYRPIDKAVLDKHGFPSIELFPVTAVARDWEDAQQKYFADKGVFDSIYKK